MPSAASPPHCPPLSNHGVCPDHGFSRCTGLHMLHTSCLYTSYHKIYLPKKEWQVHLLRKAIIPKRSGGAKPKTKVSRKSALVPRSNPRTPKLLPAPIPHPLTHRGSPMAHTLRLLSCGCRTDLAHARRGRRCPSLDRVF